MKAVVTTLIFLHYSERSLVGNEPCGLLGYLLLLLPNHAMEQFPQTTPTVLIRLARVSTSLRIDQVTCM